MIELLSDPQVWIAFLALTVLDIVQGIDNIIFTTSFANRLPVEVLDMSRTCAAIPVRLHNKPSVGVSGGGY